MYNTNTKIISAPVGIVADISKALGVASGDLGYLCSNVHGKTKKWSRFKPIQDPDKALHLKKDYDNNGIAYKAGGSCGLNIPHTGGVKSSADKYFSSEMAWGYAAPEPNELQPARALDFDGYYSDATSPISLENLPTDIWLEGGASEKRFSLSFDIQNGTTYNLGLEDIKVGRTDAQGDNELLENWYPGILMKRDNDSKLLFATSDGTVKEGGLTVEFSGSNDDLSGNWNVIPFLSTEVLALNSDETDSKCVSMDVAPFQIIVHAAGTLTYGLLSAYWIEPEEGQQYRYIGYEAFFKNYNSGEQTIKFRLSCGYSESGKPWTDMTNTKSTQSYIITIPAAKTDGTPSEVVIHSTDMGGDYPLLDIGTEYLGNKYWTVVHTGPDSTEGWSETPFDSYRPVEEPFKETSL